MKTAHEPSAGDGEITPHGLRCRVDSELMSRLEEGGTRWEHLPRPGVARSKPSRRAK